MVILSRVQQLQISNEITTLTREYSDLQAENVRMQSELAGKASNKNIQEFAEEQLGMYPLNTSQVEYVQIQTNDVVSIPEAEQNVFVRLKGWFDSILDYLRG
jgi:cell division protein FtsL